MIFVHFLYFKGNKCMKELTQKVSLFFYLLTWIVFFCDGCYEVDTIFKIAHSYFYGQQWNFEFRQFDGIK